MAEIEIVVESNERAMSLYRQHEFIDAGAVDKTDPKVIPERQMTLELRSG